MATSTESARGSQAIEPDLDWSQITETVRMLNLSVAQISMAMNEGEDSVQSLTDNFTGMVTSVNNIADVAQEMDGDVVGTETKMTIVGNCAGVQGSIQQAIIAFQFYDRLSQRLDHVKHALEQLTDVVTDRSRLFDPAAWALLQTVIRSKYTMQEEQDMFEALLAGATIDEALEQVREVIHEGDINDIELF